ncbi:unnamed protein product [Miscanthus lutarioriparius]|uniref:LOB domain-containing protein n=1 Tax=Miscanthus lutarioriparius TaxID=422564 RepID=A0A811MBE6_9POAL|nr:unnamed protein product [Miscanthus lutarioriparius]
MRMSCNGCRVLRKGCSDACTIRPCLGWIKSPEAQANATVFLAKFYGRAGLLNLLAAPPAGQDHLRPAVFRSLLYEACGRMVNPVYGSVGLLWSGQWQACQAAVEAVLKGDPVVVQVDAASSEAPPQLLGGRRYDIRHVAKDPDAAAAADLLRVARGGGRGRKRAASSSTSSKPSSNKRASPDNNNDPLRRRPQEEAEEELEQVPVVVEHEHGHDEESAGSHDHDRQLQAQQGSEDTDVEAASHSHSHVSQAEPEPQSHAPPVSSSQKADQDDVDEEEEVGLELTLGLEPLVRQRQQPKSSRCDHSGLNAASSLICLRLQLPA